MKFILTCVLGFLLSMAVSAQSPSSILSRAEKALGGKKAIQMLRSVRRTGTIRSLAEGTEGKYLMQTSKPNLLNVSFDIAGFENEIGYNGRSAWRRNSRDGLETLTGKAGVDLIAWAAYRNDLWLRYKDEKSKITAGGPASVDGKPANSVLLTTPKGSAIKIFFDAATGLPIREEMSGGDQPEVAEYSDYRSVGGVKFPFGARLTMGGRVYEIRFDEIVVDQAIPMSEFNFPVLSGEPLPNIEALLKDLQANEDRVEALLDTYSLMQRIAKREFGKDGELRETGSETFQLSFYKGRRISRLIEKNGRPLSEKEQAEADKKAAERVEEIEREAAKEASKLGKQDANGAPSNESRSISIAEVLRASKLTNPRRERFRGRDVIVFDFEPDPDFDLSKAKSMLKFFGKTAGVMWIDEHDKQVARLDAVLFESLKVGGGVLAKLQKGASFTLEQDRVNDEIWLPSRADINLSVRVLLVKGLTINQVVTSYGYRKFATEIKDAKVGEAERPQ